MHASHLWRAKFIEAVSQVLPSDLSEDLMRAWVENPKQLQKILKDALCSPPMPSELKRFRTIQLGIYRDANRLRRALKERGFRIGPRADDILAKPAFTVSTDKAEVDLMVISPAELGFSDGASYKDICTRAIELGLELCPAEVGPQLRLQFDDQPWGDWLRIAMQPIEGSDGHFGIFAVGRDYVTPCLRGGDDGRPETFWPAHERFVFMRGKTGFDELGE
jgi:hypothetical protein